MTHDTPYWQQLEADYDLAREKARARMAARREARFWPPIWGLILVLGVLAYAYIEGSL